MKRRFAIAVLLCVACVLCGCNGTNRNVMEGVTMLNTLSSEKFSDEALQNDEYKAAYDDFTYSFFRTVTAADNKKNVCLSPFSAYMAFSLCFAGSDGKTAEEFKDVFGLTKEQATEYCRSLYAHFVQREYNDENTKINLANSVWLNNADREYVKDSYLKTATDSFNAPIFTCDFSDKNTVDAINSWCKDNTDGLIDEIIKELGKDQFLAIINALLVEAAWINPYSETYGIVTDEFTDVNGKKTQQTFLQKKTEAYYYAEDAKAIMMPLRDNFSFVGILPNEDVSIEEYCAGLTTEKINKMLSYSYRRAADVTTRIPKFSLDYDVDLVKIMKSMGLVEAFDGVKANFKPMAEFPGGNAFINTALQKTHFELDENGIKAAAVTYIGLGKNAYSGETPKKIEIFLDRPFVYMLMDNSTNLPLFVGVVNTL